MKTISIFDIMAIDGETYENEFKQMFNLKIFADFSENALFCCYILDNNLMNIKDLKKFKSNITESGLKKIIEIIEVINNLEYEFAKNKERIKKLNKLLKFYLNIDNN